MGAPGTETYALLLRPASNRVYADAALRLLRQELAVFNATVLRGRFGEAVETTIAGLPCVTFIAAGLSGSDRAYLANLSSLYALFRVEGDLLRPLALHPVDRFGSDLLTIQKYPGKTNEYFTKLLLNVTAVSSAFPTGLLSGDMRVLDPLSGRGTTLNQALMYGFDAAGVEVDGRDFDAYAQFIRTWLKHKRLKHRAELGPVRRHRALLGRRLDITLAATRQQYREGKTIRIAAVHADTLRAGDFFPAESFELVVTDAPYGVQHGSHGRGGQSLSRSPAERIAAALPVWERLLRPGGALGLAWNIQVTKRAELVGLFAGSGLDVLDGDPYLGFAHRVDQAIVRDLLVARKAP